MIIRQIFLAKASFLLTILTAGLAQASEPVPWGTNFQPAASPVMEMIQDFHGILLVIQFGIIIFVLGLLGYIIMRFNAKSNPEPSKTTHHTGLEVLWTVVPILILVFVAVPSMRLLFFMDKTQQPDMTLKVVGHQWYWSYEYPDAGGLEFDSNMVPDDELKKGQRRLLEVDNRVVLPVDTNIRLILTSDDVIHSWAIPALGVKIDNVPGRINESWVRISRKGTYFGQCSELCGVNHGFMPVAIDAVSKADYAKWLVAAKVKHAKDGGNGGKTGKAPTKLAHMENTGR
jgi:cytochrome c oxidase subunit 2